ncbi:ABC transporter ATP-binding protein [Azospirillum sp. HJ39]|uniref:ABC transporter ATP-binding protein n=1 Tax=Azospirillum sp. HJ39 TaxID=3159496 RepID=UPI0035567A52
MPRMTQAAASIRKRHGSTMSLVGPDHPAADAGKTLEVRDLNHSYSVNGKTTQALKDIAFGVSAGRFLSIVGPSGCGKSSLLMMLAGLLTPSEGTIAVGGRPLTRPDPTRVGVVFQDASLFPWLTARRNVEFPLFLRGVDKAVRREKAEEALALVGLDRFADSLPHELSGGMKQRVSIARGLVQDPPILLMDEPFAALDEQTRITMGDELLRIWEKARKTIVFVTHGLSEAIYLSDEVLVLSGRPGRILDRVVIDLPRPRSLDMMAQPRFAELREAIWHMIKA